MELRSLWCNYWTIWGRNADNAFHYGIIAWVMKMDNEKELPQRKRLRLQNFDYSSSGAYFITICTKDRKMLSAPTVSEIVQSFKRYSTIEYVKMVKEGKLPPFDKQIWQRSFYDHVIRNRDDYNEIYKYIYENPMKWKFDQLYTEE